MPRASAALTTSERLVAAARRIVEEEGSAAVGVRRVAGEVGITPMAVYRHFPHVDALLGRVADDLFAELGEQWSSLSWDGDPDAGFEAALAAYLDFALSRPRLYLFLFTEMRASARSFPADFRGGQSPTLSILATGLDTGMRRGLLRRDDVWELALMVSAELHGLVHLYLGGRIAGSEQDFRSLCLRVVRRLLDGLRA